MVDSLVETLVAELRTSVQGELSGRNQVVDGLLDLRLASKDVPAVLAVIDRLLAELPGRTTVPNAWWLEALVEIERAHRSGAVAAQSAAQSPVPAAVAPAPSTPPLPRRRSQS